ncbi:GNAT family N-acetyltransferase [Lewinella sp. 4G2]|uniref:GNAT family N-acetyltransferase n=1 Tax=Lewinella sp. 4G2 TaxID=1803372 RepID=UPI0007B47608|nr:GNAT family N-acetyltransferase [Lewinella sp. 4G2]OAV44918.1 hypothetical protein A3850_010620 [Lewinella sp. 4G2]
MPTLLLNLQERLPPAKLDEFLFAGWRPVGQQLYICDFIRTETDELYGCVQIRMPLATHQFKRKQRRLLRNNGERFRYVIHPATEVTREMREVNRRYQERHPDKARTDIDFHVGYYPSKRFVDTQQVEVYDGDRLVAFSYFDPGEQCMYSKVGVYDPAYKEFSLGIYTMLLEVQWAKDNGLAYYHPGYVSVDFPIFDYKLRLGPMDYRDCATGEWKTLPDNDPRHAPDPLHLNQAAMYRLSVDLEKAGFTGKVKEYPSLTARFYYPGHGGGLVDAPFVFQLDEGIANGRLTLITYDHVKRDYTVFNPGLSSLTDIKLQPIGPTGVRRYPRPVPVEIVHLTTPSTDIIVELCKKAREGFND